MSRSQIEKIVDAKKLEISPFLSLGLNYRIEILPKIVNFNNLKLEGKSLGIKGLNLTIQLPEELINRCVQELLLLPLEVEEVWHSDYGEIDSGNIIDEKGAVSRLIDTSSGAINWEIEYPRFDKLMLRKKEDFSLTSFHFDRFNSDPSRNPSQGTMERLILNLSQSPRFLAIMDIDLNAMPYLEDDNLTEEHYLKLCKQFPVIPVLICEIPGSKQNLFHCINYEATKTLHCGIGEVGEKAIVLSKWKPFA